MRKPTFYRNTRIINSLLAMGLTLGLTLTSISVGSAQDIGGYIRHVRTLDTENISLINPVGLAYSINSKAFITIEDRSPAQAQNVDTDVISLSTYADLIASPRIAAAINDPINIAFDNKNDRLLIYSAGPKQFLEIRGSQINTSNRIPAIRHNFSGNIIQDPQGMTVDDETGQVYILDAAGPRIVRVEPSVDGNLSNAEVFEIDISSSGLIAPRGIAFDRGTGHLHVYDLINRNLYELAESGEVIVTRNLASFGLRSPQAMVFAPSGDQTDDPAQMSLFMTDSGLIIGRGQSPSEQFSPQVGESSTASDQSSGQIMEFSFTQAPAAAVSSFVSSLIKTTDLSAVSPPSPDPSGLAYLPQGNRLMAVDGEVEETVSGTTHFQGANVWELTLSGAVIRSANISKKSPTVVPMTDEPTGVAWNPTNNHYYFTDDTTKEVYDLNPGSDGLVGTSDDSWTSFDTLSIGSGDPEGIAFDSWRNRLFVADGVNEEVYEFTLAGNLVNHFDVGQYGIRDPESVEFNPYTGTLFVMSSRRATQIMVETDTSGNLLQTIDISAAGSRIAAGLAYAPASNGSGVQRFYIVDRGIDNNNDPNLIDGKLYEISAPSSGPVPTATNTAVPPTATNTPIPPTATNTPLPTATNTPVPPTNTNTPGPSPTPTNTSTNTAVPTATNTPLPPTATFTPTATTVPGVPLVFVAQADSYVKDNVPTKNFGNRTPLWVDASPNTETYLRFMVSGLSGSVQSAVLRVYSESGTVDGPAVYAADNTWTESGITWANRPSVISGLLDEVGAISRDTWVEYNVTEVVTGNGTYSFVLSTNSTDGVSFTSREGIQAPELILTVSSGPSPTATNTAVPPTATNTPIPPTATNTPLPTATNTAVPPTSTNTPGPSPTPSNTPVPPTATFTATNTPVPTATNTPLPPTATFTPTATTVPGVPLVFVAQADSYVRDSVPTKNFGGQTPLWVDASPNTEAYLRFTVSGLSGSVQSAVLRVYSESGTVDGPAVYAADNTWTESGITWANRPSVISGLLDEVGAISRDTWVEYNVTVVVTGNGTYSFVLSTNSTDGVSFTSREGIRPPELVLTIN